MDNSFSPSLLVLLLTASTSFGCEYGSGSFPVLTRVSAQPKIAPFEFPAQANAGDTVSVVCTVSGASPVRINWLKDGAALPASLARVLTEEDVSTIIFRSVGPAQTGNYTCVAENSFGRGSFTAPLSIRCESRTPVNN